jgi:hypothetical protein
MIGNKPLVVTISLLLVTAAFTPALVMTGSVAAVTPSANTPTTSAIIADPATPYERSTHTVEIEVGTALDGVDLNRTRIAYLNPFVQDGGSVAGPAGNVGQLVRYGIDTDGDGVIDTDVLAGGVTTDGTAKRLFVDDSSPATLAENDTIVLEYAGVENPGVSPDPADYEVSVTINPRTQSENSTARLDVAGTPGPVTLSNASLTPDTAEDEGVTQHTLAFDVGNVSGDDANDTVTVSLPGVATFDGVSDLTVTDAQGSPVPVYDVTGTTGGQSVSFETNTTTNVDLRVSTTFDASFGDVNADTTADATVTVNDSLVANDTTAGVPVTVLDTSGNTSTTVDVANPLLVPSEAEENAVSEHTLSFDVTNVSGDGANDTVTLSLPGVATFENASLSITDGVGAPVTPVAVSDTTGVQSISFVTNASSDTNLSVSATFNASFGEVGADTTADATVSVEDSRYGNATAGVPVTVRNVPTASTGEVDARNARLAPAIVGDDSTVTHTFRFNVTEVSADGSFDTINVTLPTVASIASADSLAIVDAGSGQQLTPSGVAVVDTAGGTANRVTARVNPTGGGIREVYVVATVTVDFQDVPADASGQVTGTVSDSVNGVDSAAAGIVAVDNGTTAPFQGGVPGTGSDAPPTNVDADPQLEDVNGDGRFDFLDVVTLLFADAGAVNADPVGKVTFDFDGDGRFSFLDVVTLLFELP